jgi:hypothetical protein
MIAAARRERVNNTQAKESGLSPAGRGLIAKDPSRPAADERPAHRAVS